MRAQEGTCTEHGDSEVTTRRGDLFDATCPTRMLLDRVGSKWTVMIVLLLANSEEARFSNLRRGMAGVSQKMLSQTLRQLEGDGLVSRRVDPAMSPPAVFYALTPLGRSLVPSLAALKSWAEEHMYAVEQHAARRSGLQSKEP